MTDFVSVIVPTYNRRLMLADTLVSLAAQDYPADSYEVVVVDDGSNDGTREWLAQEASHWSGRLVPLHQENQGPATARNHGASESRGRIVAFIDDDCIADSHWLGELSRGYISEQVAGVGGQTLPHSTDHWVERYYANRGVLQEPPTLHGAVEYLVTANASFRRQPFVEVGGFDERITLASGEDADLCARLRSKGYVMRYRQDALVYHRYSRSLRAFLTTFHRYGAGTAFYERLHLGGIRSRYWYWSLAWLRWPRDVLRYRLGGHPWSDAIRFAWLDALRDLMLLSGIVRATALGKHV